MSFKDTIINAISDGVIDLSLIEGETYTPLPFGDIVKAKGISERETLCVLYYEYCTYTAFPFVEGEKRIRLFLERIRDFEQRKEA